MVEQRTSGPDLPSLNLDFSVSCVSQVFEHQRLAKLQ